MAAATQDAPAGAVDRYTNGFMPEFFQTWEQEREQRAKDRAAKRPLQRECLDPTTAAEYESRKPRQEFIVECTYQLPKPDGSGLESKYEKVVVKAQNENDAWAMFCDRIKHWPSRHAVELTITRKGK